MATIALSGTPFGYSLGMNAFDSLGSAFTSSKKTTGDLQKSLSTLKSKIDMASVAAKTDSSQENVQKAQVREETKSSSLSLAYDKLDALICDVGKVDQRVSGRISEREDNFYKEYSYLKPDCKKSKKERRHEKWAEMRQNFKEFCGGVIGAIANIAKDVVDWAKENWKEILKIAAAVLIVAVLAIATVATGGAAGGVAGFILAGALKGAIVSGITSAAIGGGLAAINYRIKTGTWKGAGNAVFTEIANGMLTGVIIGGIAGGAGNAIKVVRAGKMWNPGTFKSGYQSMKYHYGKHAVREGFSKGNNIVKYTNDALNFSNRNSSLLKYTFNGKHGNAVWKLVFDNTTLIPGQGGSFDSTGRIIQFWYKHL